MAGARRMTADRRRAIQITAVVVGAVLASTVVVLIVPVVLRAIANAVWAFVLTPGGIVFVVLMWKWMSMQEAKARKRKRS